MSMSSGRARPKNLKNRRAAAELTTQKLPASNTQKTRFATTLLASPRRKPMVHQSLAICTVSSAAIRTSGMAVGWVCWVWAVERRRRTTNAGLRCPAGQARRLDGTLSRSHEAGWRGTACNFAEVAVGLDQRLQAVLVFALSCRVEVRPCRPDPAGPQPPPRRSPPNGGRF